MAELAGDSALLVPVHDPHALAEAVETAIAGESAASAQRRELGLLTAASYTWQACAEAHMAAYRTAVET
jgi:glycosyltransferase involved in cell wall biosynthesis